MAQTVAETLVGGLSTSASSRFLPDRRLAQSAGRCRAKLVIEWIGVRHEEGAALAASGQAKLTGRLAVCCRHHRARQYPSGRRPLRSSRDHAPVLALSGDMPRKMHGIDYFQTTEPDLLFRDVSLYTETITVAGAGSRRHPSGNRRGLCGPRRRSSHIAARRHLGDGRTAALPAWILCNRARRSRRARRT